MIPNFFIVGAVKAGTTALYYFLRDHPQVYFNSTIKEPNFLAFDESNPAHVANRTVYPIRSLDQYEELFKNVCDEDAIGDASPIYLRSKFAALQIRRLVPRARVIASLRNPVERSYSDYLMKLRSGKESRPIENIPIDEHKWINGSLYYESLKRYYDLFGKLQMKIILFEDLKLDPIDVISDICHHLDIDDTFKPDTRVNYNPSGIPRSSLIHRIFTGFGNPVVRKRMKSLIPQHWHHHVIKLRARNLQNAPNLSSEIKSNWMKLFRDDILRTQDLIGRDLSCWLS